MKITRFAWLVDESAPRSDALWDREIARTDHFVVLPSAGALVAGWTLVVPRRPIINLSHATHKERIELNDLASMIASKLGHLGQPVFCFEHGAGAPGSATGCGVDQAHLHVVPLPFDLLSAARREGGEEIAWAGPVSGADPLAALPRDSEYVALWDATERAVQIGHVRQPVSQWARRLIAEELGVAAEWDYRSHPQKERVRETLNLLKPLQTTAAR